MDYEKMLDRAYDKMPSVVFEKKRFEVPFTQVSIEGNKTIFKNFKEIIDYIGRDPAHFLKFVGREMGAAWRKDGSRLVFVGKFGAPAINQRIVKYVKLYVTCPVCEKPDTKLTKVERILVMKCMACGAVSSVPQ
ncbi:MAG: translation initiation factor IF-2 subunit beta [Candidatus Altiarchaeota archaeon]|nr:translation initiation factor IF-2 subunit beta [Candidatus Altiarchaeota archaeon]